MSSDVSPTEANEEKPVVPRQLFIASLTAAVALLLLLPAPTIAYWRGYYNGTLREPPGYLFLDEFLYIMAGTLWLLAAGFTMAAMSVAFRQQQRLGVTRFALAVVLLVVIPYTYYSRGPAASHHVMGFRDGIQTLPIDYDAIRRRLSALRRPTEFVPRQVWSKEIQDLDPQYVRIQPSGAIDIIFAGGSGHWGITIHPDPNEPPRQYNVAPGVDAWFGK